MASRFVDDRHFPLVISTLPARFGNEEIDEFLAHHDRILARNQRYGTVTDVSSVGIIPDARFRRRITDWQIDRLESMRRLTVGTAIVAPTPLLRGALTAIGWVVKAPYPEAVVATMPEGVARLREFFVAAGLGAQFPSSLGDRVAERG